MASAKANTREVTVMRPVTETVIDGVVLSLSMDEAEALGDILRRIGGSPHTTRRGLSSAMLSALASAGIKRGLSDGSDLDGQLKFS